METTFSGHTHDGVEHWQKGPLPPDTYGWGGVTKASEPKSVGFYFADFCGDKVKCVAGEGNCFELQPHEVGMYNNCLCLPPKA